MISSAPVSQRVGAAFIAMHAFWSVSCRDIDPVTVSQGAPPPITIGDSGSDADSEASAPLSPCRACVREPTVGVGECTDVGVVCLEDTTCSFLFECMFAAGCLEVPPAELVGCASACAAQVGVNAPGHPAAIKGAPLLACVQSTCEDICGQ